MTIIDQIKLAATQPGVRVWVEEALFRGAIDPTGAAQFGVIAGAHFVMGVEAPNLIGQPTRQLLGPFPAAMVPTGDQSAMADLIGLATVIQQQTIDVQAADLAARDATVAQQSAALAERDATIAAQSARIAELEAVAVEPSA